MGGRRSMGIQAGEGGTAIARDGARSTGAERWERLGSRPSPVGGTAEPRRRRVGGEAVCATPRLPAPALPWSQGSQPGGYQLRRAADSRATADAAWGGERGV
jgi:hypothetical protein